MDFRSAYLDHVKALQKKLSGETALREAVGGEFIAVGTIEYHLLRFLGMGDGHLVVDVGCGSGRLACQLAPFPGIRYIGSDVVPQLLEYARSLTGRSDWSFFESDGQRIPCDNAVADFVVFFSVFTHLLHEDTFKYFREAQRCLRQDGLMVFSFLEFRIPCHWTTFLASVNGGTPGQHLNQFMDREAIHVWANQSGLAVVAIHDGDTGHIPIPEEVLWANGTRMVGLGNLGQSVAILRKL